MRIRLLLALCALLAPGCGSGGSAPTNASPGSNAARAAPVEKTPGEGIREDYERVQKAMSAHGTDTRGKIQLVRGFIARSQRIAPEGNVPEIEAAEKLVVDLEQELVNAAKEAFQELEEKVMAIIDSEQPDHVRAEEIVDRFDVTRFPGSDIRTWVAEIRERILIYQAAETDYLLRKGRVETFSNDFARMVGYLEGFDPRYDETPSGAKIRQLIKQKYAEYIEYQAKQTAEGGAVATKRWDVSDRHVEGPGDLPVSYDKTSEVLSFGPNPRDYDDRDSPGSFILLGSEAWLDVGLTLDLRVNDIEKVRLGVKGREGDGGKFRWIPIELTQLGLDAQAIEDWIQLVITVNQGLVSVQCLTTQRTVKFEHQYPDVPGRFVVQILGDEAKASIRSLTYQVVDRDGADVAGGSGTDDPDDRTIDLDDLDDGDDPGS